MLDTDTTVLPHHRDAAQVWGKGGRDYDDISFVISDALAHAAQRLSASAGDAALDVATGTGWTARNVARSGADVTAVDISEALLDAARSLSGPRYRAIRYRQADAENLPFADGQFDRVISTFGVMFAANHEKAASELARVCRPGGRLALATWVPGGSVAEFFGLIAKHGEAPAPKRSPLDWGDPACLARLLGGSFDLTFERGMSNAYHDSPEHIRNWYMRGFGPVRDVMERLEGDARTAFIQDLDAYHARYRTADGLLHIKREYLVTIGERR